MTTVIMTVLLLFTNGEFQVTEIDTRYWSLEHCADDAQIAAPQIFADIPNVEEIRYTCREVE